MTGNGDFPATTFTVSVYKTFVPGRLRRTIAVTFPFTSVRRQHLNLRQHVPQIYSAELTPVWVPRFLYEQIYRGI
jgi:hypothetical protein